MAPSIPTTSGPVAGPSNQRPSTSRLSATPFPKVPLSEEFKENEFFKQLCAVEPGSVEAEDLLYEVTDGISPLLDLDEKKQMPLLYEAFKHIFCRSLSEC